jgi:hypothetical protein
VLLTSLLLIVGSIPAFGFDVLTYTWVSTLVLVFSLALLRTQRAGEVYVLWYVFFFITFVAFGMYLYLDSQKLISDWHTFDPFIQQEPKNQRTPERLIYSFIGLYSSLGDEIIFVVILIAIVVVPQIAAYVASGIFGCAQTPIFVSTASDLSILSLYKFFCGLAALQMSSSLFKLYSFWKYAEWPSLYDFDIIRRPAMTLAGSFLLAAIYYWLLKRGESWGKLLMKRDRIKRMKTWMTRANESDGGRSFVGRVASAALRAAAVEAASLTAADIKEIKRLLK